MNLSVDEAYALLTQLGAPSRLIRHAELVIEAAEVLISHFSNIGLEFDVQLVRLGCILHDIGKISHPDELQKEGTQHTTAGHELLVTNGIEPRVADFCVSHEHWQADSPSLETLMVALADKLWKGQRHTELETATIQQVSVMTGQDFWTILIVSDTVFEAVADTGPQRLTSSIQ